MAVINSHLSLRIVNWDVAHATRRLTQRPWKADAFIKDVVGRFVTNRRCDKTKTPLSIVRLIQHSQEFKELMKTNIDNMGKQQVGHRVCNFQFAAHRYDSVSKPIGRAVHHFRALLTTATQIANLRTDSSAQTAVSFLAWLNSERAIQLAMVADAASHAMLLTRLADNEKMRTEEFAWRLEEFLCKMKMLFIDTECQRFGYVQYILKVLEDPMLIYVRGQPKVLGKTGGVSHLLTACCDRMACWIKLCESVARAEFPHFGILAAFSVFRLRDDEDADAGETDGRISRKLQRLAKFTKVNFEDLSAQHNDLYQRAAVAKRMEANMSNFTAWKQTVKRATSRDVGRGGVAVDAILPILDMWVGWSCSSSGVEQMIASIDRLLDKHSNNLVDDRTQDLLILCHDKLSPEDEKAMLAGARSHWTTQFGTSRRHQKRHFCAGVRRVGGDLTVEKNWIKKITKDVHRKLKSWLPSKAKGVDDRLNERSKRKWTPSMDAEVDFQNQKRFKRLVHASHVGLADAKDSNRPSQFEAQRSIVEKAEVKAARNLSKIEERRSQAKTTGRIHCEPFQQIRGMKLYVDANIADRDKVVKEVVHQRAEATTSRHNASAFVCEDIAKPGQRVELIAIFRGVRVMSPEFLMTRGQKGVQVCYHAAGPMLTTGTGLKLTHRFICLGGGGSMVVEW